MKRCPECRRDYYDDSLQYCLDDGAHLLDGPASVGSDEQRTAILSEPELLAAGAGALANARKASEITGPGRRVRQVEGYVHAVIGNRDEALTIAREMEEEFAKGLADGRDVAVVYAGLGENDKVFEWLEKDFQKRSTSLVELRMEVPFFPLHTDPRFRDLLRRIGLPE